MKIDTSIFKAYDIRGIYPDEINADVAYAIGRAYATWLTRGKHAHTPTMAVGSDARLSSPELKGAVIEGILDSGVNVDDIGLVSTPTFYFGVAYLGYAAGLQVSASHNPKEWNGFKLALKGAVPVGYDSGIREIQQILERDEFTPRASGEARGVLRVRDGVTETAAREQIDKTRMPRKRYKIAVDAGSGTGALDMKYLFKQVPADVVWLNDELDGNFPAHPADPMRPENTEELRKSVVAEHCDLGIASDGDGDRYFFFDERGDVVPQEILRGIMAQIELKEHPASTVVYDIRPGRITKDMIEEAGGRAVVAPVGHSLIKAAMLREQAIFGGESSGHFFYKLPYGSFEAPMVLVQKFLGFLSAQDKPLSEVVAPFKQYANSGEINTKIASRDEGLKKLAALKKTYADGAQNELDGLTVEYPDFWFNARLSNTGEPTLRLAVEANSRATMEKKRDELLALVRA